MEKKEKWIRRIPAPFDHGKARQYLKLFREFLKEKVHAKLDQYLAQSLTSASNCAGTLASEVENLMRTMSNVATDNETAMKEIETGPPNTSFVQRTITGPEFKKWCDDHFATVPDTIQISALDVAHLLNAVLSPLLKDYQAHLRQVNMITDVRASRALKNRVGATEVAAEPLINLTNTGPSLEEMMANKLLPRNFLRTASLPPRELQAARTGPGQRDSHRRSLPPHLPPDSTRLRRGALDQLRELGHLLPAAGMAVPTPCPITRT